MLLSSSSLLLLQQQNCRSRCGWLDIKAKFVSFANMLNNTQEANTKLIFIPTERTSRGERKKEKKNISSRLHSVSFFFSFSVNFRRSSTWLASPCPMLATFFHNLFIVRASSERGRTFVSFVAHATCGKCQCECAMSLHTSEFVIVCLWLRIRCSPCSTHNQSCFMRVYGRRRYLLSLTSFASPQRLHCTLVRHQRHLLFMFFKF